MTGLPKPVSICAVVASLAISAMPAASLAQSAGGGAGGSSGAAASRSGGGATASPGATQGALGPGTPSSPGSPPASDPSGVARAAQGQPSTPGINSPGTNSLGTAQSSGSSVNTAPGITTGTGRQPSAGVDVTGPNRPGDAAVEEENRVVDQKVKSICRGC